MVIIHEFPFLRFACRPYALARLKHCLLRQTPVHARILNGRLIPNLRDTDCSGANIAEETLNCVGLIYNACVSAIKQPICGLDTQLRRKHDISSYTQTLLARNIATAGMPGLEIIMNAPEQCPSRINFRRGLG